MHGRGQTRLSYTGSHSNELRSTKQVFLLKEECLKRSSGFQLDEDFCTQTYDKTKRCPGQSDSGGSLIYRDSISDCPILRGVVKAGDFNCNFTTYTDVLLYKEWIEETMKRYTRPHNQKNYTYSPRNKE